MKYDRNKHPNNKIVWGCAYSTSNTEKSMVARKKPVKGMIKNGYFYEFKKDGTLKGSGIVSVWSRCYADTKEECIEMYNEKVQNQIDFLKNLIEQCEQDMIDSEPVAISGVQK